MNKVINYVYYIGNFFLDIYYSSKSKFLFLEDIQKEKNETDNKYEQTILFCKFYLSYYLYNYGLYNYMASYFKQLTKHHNLIKIQLTNGYIQRHIIFRNIRFDNLITKVYDLVNNKHCELYNENELLMMNKIPVMDIYYKDNNNNKISIKNILNKYADKSNLYNDNTIKNIFSIENINNHDNKLYSSFLIKFKKVDKAFDLDDDHHVSYVYLF